MNMPCELRLLDSVREYVVLELPIVFAGSLRQCLDYAKKHGYIWRHTSDIHGGYFVDADGNCLFPT